MLKRTKTFFPNESMQPKKPGSRNVGKASAGITFT